MGSSTERLLWAIIFALPYITSANPLGILRGVEPNSPYDLATTKYCTYWYDNYEGKTCSEVAAAYHLDEADMISWNPSLSATCGNWQDEMSYCVEANGAPTSTHSIIPSTSTTKSATSTSTAIPTWTALGCYLDSSNPPTLTLRTTVDGGDLRVTIEACETACYKIGSMYAGLEAGSQCWCGNYVANERAANTTDCNAPCNGNAAQICGGRGRVNVYKAVLPTISTSRTRTSITTSSSITTSLSTTTSKISSTTVSSSTITSSSTTASPSITTSNMSSSATVNIRYRLLHGFAWGVMVVML